MEKAEIAILRWQQQISFPEELKRLEGKTTKGEKVKEVLPRASSIYSLDPYLENGLLCVGGRIRRAGLLDEEKHPVILPSKCTVTQLIVQNEHINLGHVGRNHVLSNLRR